MWQVRNNLPQSCRKQVKPELETEVPVVSGQGLDKGTLHTFGAFPLRGEERMVASVGSSVAEANIWHGVNNSARLSRVRGGCFRSRDLGLSQQIINSAFVHERGATEERVPDLWETHAHYFDAVRDTTVVGTLRLVLPSPLGIPLSEVFDIEALGLDRPAAEITHFVVLPQFRGRLVAYEWEAANACARLASCGYILIESLIELERFYARLGFARCGSPLHDPRTRTRGCTGSVNVVPMLMAL